MNDAVPELDPAARERHAFVSDAWRGALAALSLPAWIVGASLLGVGSLARDVGHPLGAAIASTIFVWAGPAQVLFYCGVATGAAWGAIALAVCFSSLRLLPMTVALLPVLRRPNQSVAMQLLIAHYVAVTVWTESMRLLPREPEARRVGFYLGFANACLVVSAAMTGLGYVLVGALPALLAAGLLFLTPLFFSVAVAVSVRGRHDAAAPLLGFVGAPLAAAFAPGGFDLIVVGLVAGTAAFAWRRLAGQRAGAA